MAAAAVKVAASLGVRGADPVILADGANVIVHLSPAPVVAKVAASTTAVRRDDDAWPRRRPASGWTARASWPPTASRWTRLGSRPASSSGGCT
jgi:hypothetical protein